MVSTPSEAWMKQRKLTMVGFIIQNLLLGFDLSLLLSNLWVYIETLAKPDHPKIYYGAITVAYTLSSAATSYVICNIADRHRCVRKIFFVTNLALVFGNILYVIHFSPWFLLFGRFLGGAGLSQRSIITGEIARCFKREELTSKFSIMGLAFSSGFLLAPMFNLLFTHVDFHLGMLHITFANISGLYIAALFMFSIVICYFMVFDLSKEFDMKATESETDDPLKYQTMNDSEPISVDDLVEKDVTETTILLDERSKPDAIWFTKQMFKKYDTLLLLLISFFENFLIVSFTISIPIIIIDILHWPVSGLNYILLGDGVCSVIPCVLLIYKTFSDAQIFHLSLFGIVAYTLIQLFQIIFAVYSRDLTTNIILATIYCLLFSNVMIIKDVFLGGFLAKMIASKYQALGDSVRLAVCRVGSIAAFLSSPFAVEYIEIIGWIYIIIILILGVLLYLRRKTIGDPRIIIQ